MGKASRKMIRMASAWVRRWLEVKGGGPNLRWRGPPYREPEPLPGVHPGQPARENGGEKTDIRSDSQFPRVEGMKPDDQSADQTNTMCPQIRICGHKQQAQFSVCKTKNLPTNPGPSPDSSSLFRFRGLFVFSGALLVRSQPTYPAARPTSTSTQTPNLKSQDINLKKPKPKTNSNSYQIIY